MQDTDFKKLSKNALKCRYLRWILAFLFLLAIELATVYIAAKLLYGILLAAIKYISLSFPLLFILFVSIYPYYKHKNISYRTDKANIEIYSGIIKKTKEIIPIKNIQHIELFASPFERFYKLSSMKLYTAGSSHNLNFIELEDAKYIQSLVYKDELCR